MIWSILHYIIDTLLIEIAPITVGEILIVFCTGILVGVIYGWRNKK